MPAEILWRVRAEPSLPAQTTAGPKNFRDLKLGPGGDLVVLNGDLATVSGLDAVAQGVQVALQLWKGEWFDDPTAGVDWLSILGQKGLGEPAIRAALTKAITSVRGVKSVASMTIDLTGRQLTVSFTALADGGVISGGTA